MSQAEAISKSDSEVIAAIRNGDRELFRELVERHGSAVFGITWSRLGDRSLAEEAAQETFIRAYRSLGLLRKTERFGAWIATIARRVSTNLGIRNRREIDKREQWKLEQGARISEESANEGELSDETLRQTLASLPATHRETLVLYYVEGKSIAEAAAALGITETAFKTRMHRARECMRSALESRLETSLEKLRPSTHFAAGVMLALPTQAGSSMLGGGIFASAFKFAPAAYFGLLIQFLALVPTLFFARWLGRKEQENFRDPEGFRARNYARMWRRALWTISCLVLGSAFLFRTSPEVAWSMLLVVLGVPMLVCCARRLYLLRNRHAFAEMAVSVVLIGAGVVFFAGLPLYWLQFLNAVVFAVLPFTLGMVSPQMDYSLFLRAAEGLFDADIHASTRKASYSRGQLFAFARFLAKRCLVADWQWDGEQIVLKLPPVMFRSYMGFLPLFWRGASTVCIGPSGDVSARLSASGERDLRAMGHKQVADELLAIVSANVARALEEFAAGDFECAKRHLGEEAEDRIYRVSPGRTVAARVRKRSFPVVAVLSLGAGFYAQKQYWSGHKKGLTPLVLTEAGFRPALEAAVVASTNSDVLALHVLKFPERHLFSVNALESFHALLRTRIDRYHGTNQLQRGTAALLHDDFLQRAFESGLIYARGVSRVRNIDFRCPEGGSVVAGIAQIILPEFLADPDGAAELHGVGYCAVESAHEHN